MSEKRKLPNPGIIPASTPAEGARWVMNNREEAERRVRKLRKEVQEATGRSSSSTTSIPSKAFSENWEEIFGKGKK